jgi:hypothetical protein
MTRNPMNLKLTAIALLTTSTFSHALITSIAQNRVAYGYQLLHESATPFDYSFPGYGVDGGSESESRMYNGASIHVNLNWAIDASPTTLGGSASVSGSQSFDGELTSDLPSHGSGFMTQRFFNLSAGSYKLDVNLNGAVNFSFYSLHLPDPLYYISEQSASVSESMTFSLPEGSYYIFATAAQGGTTPLYREPDFQSSASSFSYRFSGGGTGSTVPDSGSTLPIAMAGFGLLAVCRKLARR